MYNIFTLAQEWEAQGMDTSLPVMVDIDGALFMVVGTRKEPHAIVIEIPEEGTE